MTTGGEGSGTSSRRRPSARAGSVMVRGREVVGFARSEAAAASLEAKNAAVPGCTNTPYCGMSVVR